MDTVDVKAEEKSGLLSAIQKEMKASKGYKVVKVIQVILLVLFWITLIATATVSLLLNGAFELLTNLGQEIDAFSSILQIALRSCGPLFTIWAVYTMIVSVPVFAVKQWILKKRVAEAGYDPEETLTSFRYKLARANERKSTEEAFLEAVGWNILSSDYGNKNPLVKFFRFLAGIGFYISTAVLLLGVRVLLALWSLDLLNKLTSQPWFGGASIAFLVVLFVFFWAVGRAQNNGRKKLLDTLQRSLKQKADATEEAPVEEVAEVAEEATEEVEEAAKETPSDSE